MNSDFNIIHERYDNLPNKQFERMENFFDLLLSKLYVLKLLVAVGKSTIMVLQKPYLISKAIKMLGLLFSST